MKNYHKSIGTVVICLLAVLSCSKKPTDYRSFLGGSEIVYPGVVSNTAVFPGNGRLMLTWHPSPDPSVTKYVVYWNNYADSLTVPAVSHNLSDTVKCVVNNLSEYVYTFFVYTYDSIGNKSIATEIDNARVYGSIYQSSLHNRLPDGSTPYIVNNDGSVTLNFSIPDTINIVTNIKYTNTGGTLSQIPLLPNNTSVTLTDYKFNTPVLYQSSYIPVQGALDTFYTTLYDTFPSIYRLVQCDKSLFAETNQPSDMQPYESDTRVSVLWNGSIGPQGYPNIFHSNGANPLPGTISFDMGKIYNNLSVIEETGRNCCHNPIDFEVWGIADTTGAYPTLASNNPGWKSQTIANGWVLLTEAIRTDDGSAPMKFNFISNPPPVRFIRIRVIKTADDPNYANMSQLTFWNKQ
jgi:hypothetical protein